MKKLNFFLDIDGTLLPHGKSRISDEVFSAILKAKEGGSAFFINTARPHWLVPEDVFPPEIFDGICSGCGTHITYRGNTIYKSFLAEEKALKVLLNIEKNKLSELSVIVECLENNYYYGKELPWYVSTTYQKLDSAAALGTVFKNINIQKLCFNRTEDEFPKGIFAEMEKEFDVLIHPTYAEAVPKGFSKGAAIRIAEKELNIPHESTVAIGDSLNDAEMLKYAAISVAMGNAPDSVKDLCDFVTDTADEHGVAKAILKLTNEM